MAETYTIDRIADLFKVPSERREECTRQLLIAMELVELAGAEIGGSFTWTDDGDPSCALTNEAGEALLKLEVTRG